MDIRKRFKNEESHGLVRKINTRPNTAQATPPSGGASWPPVIGYSKNAHLKSLAMNRTLILVIVFVTLMLNGCKKSVQQKNTIESREIIRNSQTKTPSFIGKEWGKKVLDRYLTDTSANLFHNRILIQDTTTLILIAEPILFDIYGKNQIIDEKPYEIYLYGDYWLMMGTLPEGWQGGTFSIVINRKTCEVKGISHGK